MMAVTARAMSGLDSFNLNYRNSVLKVRSSTRSRLLNKFNFVSFNELTFSS